MAEWQTLLIQLCGKAAVVLVPVGLMGWWLWNKINTALDSYTKAYAQQTAHIDASIANLEKLTEEQARLTRTVESIKDDIAAQRRLENNRWDFKREVYLNLVTFGFELLGHLGSFQQILDEPAERHPLLGSYQQFLQDPSKGPPLEPFDRCLDSLTRYACVAELATADELKPVLEELKDHLANTPDVNGPEAATILARYTAKLREIVLRIRTAGRKDLWGTPESAAKAVAPVGGQTSYLTAEPKEVRDTLT